MLSAHQEISQNLGTPRTRKRRAGKWKRNAILTAEDECPYKDFRTTDPRAADAGNTADKTNDTENASSVKSEDECVADESQKESEDREQTEGNKSVINGTKVEPLETTDQECYDIESLSDVPLIIKIYGVEHQADLFDINPNMSVVVECGM